MPATTKCRRCHRVLRSAESIARQMGRTCARRVRQESAAKSILVEFTPVQVEKVRELLADGGIARVTRHLYLAVASNGTDRYEVDTTAASCTCKAGERGVRCYHLGAALLAAA